MAISSWKHPHNLVYLVRELSEQYAIVAAADEELERAAKDGHMDPCELGKMQHEYRITAANFFNRFTASKLADLEFHLLGTIALLDNPGKTMKRYLDTVI